MLDDGKLAGFRLLAKILFAGSVFLLPVENALVTCCGIRSRQNGRSVRAGGSRFGLPLLLFFALLMAMASPAQAADKFCSQPPFNGVIDGDVLGTSPTQITIDTDCTFQNWPASKPLTATINFQTNDPTIYLIVFDNVVYDGNLACSSIDHALWIVNSTFLKGVSASCQDLLIPVETIAKQAPATTATIGVPFTYTLTMPSMQFPVGAPSDNTLHDVVLWDDLTATGADLTYVSINAYYKGSGTPVTLVPEDQPQPTSKGGVWTSKNLSYKPIPLILLGEQIIVEITVVLDDTPTNVAGTTFINRAEWWFGRLIEIDGVPTFFDPLPGEGGESELMTVAEPDLEVSKSSTETALNLGIPATFTIDVQNTGGSDAWNVTILDQFPDGATAGMCDFDPTASVSARIFEADGTTPVSGLLAPGFDYSVTYTAATCELSLTMLTANAVIGPTQRLIITYQSELDDPGTTADGFALTNVAGATQWFSADSSLTGRRQYDRTLTDGTPTINDHQGSYTITTALSGYFFQKTVQNLTTGADPATTAAPGDRLRYRLRVFNVDEAINNITISDILDPLLFDTSTFSVVTLAAGTTFSFNSGSGQLQILGNPPPLNLLPNLTPPAELVVEFEIDLAPGLANGTVVPNQASLTADAPFPNITSDDPFVNGIAAPFDPTDSTNVLIQTPGPLLKVSPAQTSASIGELFTYTITVPAAPVDVALYDVRILDDLTASTVDMRFISANVVSGGSWTLSNTGTDTSPVIEDTVTGIDIPALGQAVIEITVELQNTATNQSGLLFNNSASYTYNRSNGDTGTQTDGGAGATTDMTVIEPDLTAVSKVGTLITAAPVSGGSIIEYVVTMVNSGNATAYDVNIVDTLPPELALYATFTPTATIDGVDVAGFITTPSGTPAGPLIWGDGNGDGSLDIPAGSNLVLTYQAQVQISSVATFNNTVSIDWSSLDGGIAAERTGAGCPTITAPDDYCVTATGNAFTIIDNNSLTKAVIADSWITDGSTAVDATVRIGDTATYQLTLNLGEGTTNSVTVSDVLPAGLAFDSLVSITPASVAVPGSGDFNYTVVSQPAAGATGTLVWALANVVNTPSNDATPVDALVIEYRVKVLQGVIAQTATSTLTNTATLSYLNSGLVADPTVLVDTAALTLLQPTLTVSKNVAPAGGDLVINAGELITYTVDVVNGGLAPAYDTVVEDIIPAGLRAGGVTTTSITIAGVPVTSFNPTYVLATGTATWNFDNGVADAYTIPAGQTLQIAYTVLADAAIGPGLTLINAATATLYYSFDDEVIPVNSVVADREVYGPGNTATTTLTTAPGTPLKENPADPTVTIGQEFTYTITVPNTPQPIALYDIRVLDDLGTIAADLTLIGISKISPIAATWVPTNSGTGTNLIIEDTTNGIDIPANQQIVIGVTVRLDNSAANNDGLLFSNSASYTYNQIDGDNLTQLDGGSSTTADMTVVESALIVTKVGTPTPAVPITGGSIIEYVITMDNSGGNDTAYDVNVVDTLPAELALYGSFTPTATIGGIGVGGFVSAPAGAPAGPLIWGQGNGDGNLDIPAGDILILTYRAQVQVSTAATFNNEVWVDWTSLEGGSAFERTGAGCPTITAPDDYCATATSLPFVIVDNNSLTKAVTADSYVDAFSTVNDATVRIGDTATYQLTLNLGEGTTNSVTVSDVLPVGMAFDSLVSITPVSGGTFTYTVTTQPGAGDTGTLVWDFGTIINIPSNDGTPTDALVIEYIARVLPDAGIAQGPIATLTNTATLGYLDGGGTPVIDPTRLVDIADLTLWQPVMGTITKTGNGFTNTAATPLNVNVATDTVAFQLQSCNAAAPAAPAYSVLLSDVLATQLDETSIVGPTVIINGAAATAGVDYIYTPPAIRGGTLQIELLTPVNPGQCVTVDYNIGFHTDFGPNQVWNNSVTLDEYWSLPAKSGQQYLPLGPAQFFMTNVVVVEPLTKSVFSPVSGELTIGEEAVYTITVPGNPVNAVLDNVVVSDTLHAALEYIDATAVDGGGLPVALTDNSIAPGAVSLTIAQIPAGEQVVITLRTRVANNAAANAGTSFTNTAAYTYTGIPAAAVTGGISGPLLIVEPLVTIAKTVAPLTPPNAGDILTYSLTFTASGGASFSDAFDLSINDNLSLGLAYVPVSSTVDGGNTITDPVIVGDGIITPQTLTWDLSGGDDIDVVEGSTVIVTYNVVVLDSVLAGQVLSNSASAQWTGLDTINPLERTGTGTPAENGYFTGPVFTTLTTLDNTTLTKTRLSDTYNVADANVRIGDLLDYELRIHLDEGSHSGLILSDVLPQGLQFEQVLSINGDAAAPYGAVAPFTHNDIATPSISGTAITGPTTVTWTLGDVVNVSDGNAANDDFVIVYRARLLNNDVFPQVNSTPLINTVTLNYTIATGPASQIDIESILLLQPDLTVSKSVAAAGGDTIIDAGELITYTVDVVNNGLAPAYDTVIEDIIPLGLRQGVVTTTSITIAGVPVTAFDPTYVPATGTATWNFDSGGADTYTIPAGQTLQITYSVLADADLGPGLTLINTVSATLYYSFDDEAVPANGNVNDREIYGPSLPDTTTLTTALPVALLKETTQTTATIGEQFTYRITVPATPQTTALKAVRILDDLNTSAADLTFVSVTKIAGSQPWTPVNTGDLKNVVIEDTSIGIDIPAGEQAVIEITVELDDSATNVSALVFNNTADYTYNVTQDPGLPGTSGDTTIIGPDSMTLEKSGPATMRVGLPETFTINVQNTGTAPAWDLTITDVLPNPTPGGMCDSAPTNITAQIFQADGTTPVSAVLTQGTDYISSFSGEPGCTFTVTMQSVAAVIGADQRLIVSYEASIDNNSVGGTSLTNIAAATEWFSGDTAGAGASGAIRTYTGILSDGTVSTLDEQDAHTLLTEFPVLVFQKSVINVTTGQDPGADAQPGDTLRYTLYVENISPVTLPDFSLVDELDALNASAMFVAGSLSLISVPVGADSSNTDPNGGVNGTGLLDIRNMSLDAQGGANDRLELSFEVTLVPVIDSGTVVLNQTSLVTYGVTIGNSDDPNVNGADDPNIAGDEDPTETLITSAPVFQVEKTSMDITGDPAILEAGDTLRYTITVKNIGLENSVNTLLSDQVPANTAYVASSTTLNGVAVSDPVAGISALASGLLINAPENTTVGFMRADTDPLANNVATISFDVVISSSAIGGTVISNQGFVSGDGAGTSGAYPLRPSDDPDTTLADDPTLDVVGNVPVVDVLKTVSIQIDNGTVGIVDPGDTLRYTITTTNIGAVPATGVVLTDAVPANTTYVGNSTALNGIAITDPGVNVSPLISGIDISSGDFTPPLPTAGNGTLSAGGSAVVIFDVLVDAAALPTTIISNQGFVSNNELPTEPTDSDGNDGNGDQPTVVVVGNVQQLAITKQVFVVGGGVAQAGGELEYVVRVTNIGGIAATNVVITDNLDLPVAGQMTYVAGSGLLNGLATGLSFVDPVLSADYSATYGDLPPAGVAELRFRVSLDAALAVGTTISNTGEVSWNAPPATVSATVNIDIGGTPGSANLNGQVWHDTDFSNDVAASETMLLNWTVELYRNNVLLANTQTDVNGVFQFSGLLPNLPAGNAYELRYSAPGAVANTATLGTASSVFTNAPQRISDIFAASGSSLQNLNLPMQPNGVVYDSLLRVPVAGVRLTMVNQTRSNQLVPASCFDDPNHQNQLTPAEGFYKFDLNFSDPTRCAEGDEYEIQVQPPATAYVGTTSVIVPPVNPVTGAAQDVANCPGTAADSIPATTLHCENSVNAVQPDTSIAAGTAGTRYYLKFLFNDVPSTDQIFNNHIPVDPELDAAVAVSKVAGLLNVTRSQLVPYTITLNNTFGVPLGSLNVIDDLPAGFKYVTGSSRVDGVEVEPVINGRQLTWPMAILGINETRVIKLLLVVGSGVGEGEYINTAHLINALTGGAASGVASATVQVIPDPTFDCSDIIGKVFDDANNNAYQDQGEKGLAGVQIATARGLRVTTDAHGRFHITCAIVPNEIRGSNFIMKVDDRTLPSGYRITTENPRVQRATRGKMLKFNFGATIHRVVRLDLANGVFERGATELRPQWRSRIDLLLIELQKDTSILRLSYLGENETEAEVEDRLDAIEELIAERWQEINCCYKLTIEKEVFWRKGHPSDRKGFE